MMITAVLSDFKPARLFFQTTVVVFIYCPSEKLLLPVRSNLTTCRATKSIFYISNAILIASLTTVSCSISSL